MEFFGMPPREQKKMPIREWYEYYEVAIKRHKQKIELLSLNRI
jgi:hypothetical protein